MVSKEDKEKMLQFITRIFEENPYIEILSSAKNELQIKQKKDNARGMSASAGVYLHSSKMTKKDFKKLLDSYRAKGSCLINIFYKNYIDFFVRVAECPEKKSESWRTNKSFKNYNERQINSMLHLRDLEKLALQFYGCPLAYFQPKTETLDESLRLFEMENVILDYSHIPYDELRKMNRGLQEESVIYVIPVDKGKIISGDGFSIDFSKKTNYVNSINYIYPKIIMFET